MEYFKNFIGAYKKYAEFNGRSSREEYWSFYIWYSFIVVFFALIDTAIGKEGFLSAIYILITILPSISITTRRLHDINKSGWWQLILLAPLLGWIIIFILTLIKGKEEEKNRFDEG